MNDWKFHFWLNHVSLFYFERELYGEQRDILCDFARDIYTIAEIEKLFARDHVTDLWQQ